MWSFFCLLWDAQCSTSRLHLLICDISIHRKHLYRGNDLKRAYLVDITLWRSRVISPRQLVLVFKVDALVTVECHHYLHDFDHYYVWRSRTRVGILVLRNRSAICPFFGRAVGTNMQSPPLESQLILVAEPADARSHIFLSIWKCAD